MNLGKIRHLDVDDLYVMSRLLDDVRMGVLSKKLGISPPAISHRRRKYEDLFPGFFMEKKSSSQRQMLSPKGIEICKKMKLAYDILMKI